MPGNKRPRGGKTTQKTGFDVVEEPEEFSQQALLDENESDSSEYSDLGEQDSEDSEQSEEDSEEALPQNLAELSDSSDDEGMKNRVGNVPLKWYKDHDHIGYDISGKRIARKPKKDAIDELLARRDPDAPYAHLYIVYSTEMLFCMLE